MYRIGEGCDVHRLVANKELILGGVKIPYDKGLLGHSDADVLLHAIMDALLGAAALGDIGKFFPDTDDKYKGISSIELLKEVKNILSGNNESKKVYNIVNVDSTIICQEPKLRNHIDKIRQNIANALDINIENVSVKATTEEGLGFTGRKEGIAARAICILDQS